MFGARAGEPCRVPKLGPAAKHGQGASQRGRARVECGQPAQDGPAHALGADVGHVASGVSRRPNLGVDQRRDELAEQERVAARSGVGGLR